MKGVMVESAREMWGSVREGRENPQSVWWNNEVKARKEADWNDVL